jgi:branched chain amino acid efflux pump
MTVVDAPASCSPNECLTEIRAGALAMAPFVVGYAPFALVIGAAVAAHGHPIAGWAGSWLIYGGSAHLAALRTIDDGGALLAIVTGLLINARLLVYSASVAPHWQRQPRWFRAVGAAMLIDPTWAVAERRATQPGSDRAQRAYYLAAGLTLGVGWSALIAVGAVAGNIVSGVGLEVAAPLCLISLVAPRLKDGDTRAAAIVAALVSVFAARWPAGTGMLAAIAAGCAGAALVGRRST